MSRSGHTPMRTCIACRRRAAGRVLERFVSVRRRDGFELRHDRRRRLPGRGAWLCRSRECLERALSGSAFARAVGAPAESLRLDAGLYESFAVSAAGGIDGD